MGSSDTIVVQSELRDSPNFIILHGRWRKKIVTKKSAPPYEIIAKKNYPVAVSLKMHLPCIHEQQILYSTIVPLMT